MTKDEEATIRLILARLKEPRLGCAEPFPGPEAKAERQAPGYEGVSRIYVETWIAGPLALLLPGEDRNPKLARKMATK